jgi:hypothetical protein
MKKSMFWIALAALIIPALARGLWYYRGIPKQSEIATPDYQALTLSHPPFETPVPEKDLLVTDEIRKKPGGTGGGPPGVGVFR